MPTDIRNTGALNYRALQQQNNEKFNSQDLSDDDLMRLAVNMGRNLNAFTPEATEDIGIQAAQAGYGKSQYDDAVATTSQLENLGEVRYNEQPWYDTLANGIGKMLGTAGTTFVSSLVGLPYGLYQAGKQQRWSALWDNDVTQGLADVDKWLEENMTNYKSQKQQNSPWWSADNLFSMNFIADDVIKNAGFTLGAAASMAVGSGSLGLMGRALGFVNNVGKGTKMGSAALSALFSATGEGMIEARQGVEERNKLEMQRLDDALNPEYDALQTELQQITQEYEQTKGQSLVRGADGKAVDPAYEAYRQRMADLSARRDALDQRKQAAQQQIIESGQNMGNAILLANQGLLTAGNLIQFGKGMVKSFDKARHAAEVSSKAAKPFGGTAERVSNNLRDGYKIGGKNFGRVVAGTKGLVTEGSEEMNQQMIQSSSGAAYTEKDVNDYWKAKLDPESYRETTKGLYTMGQILDRGFQESWGDPEQWEQFVIGGLTGMMGSYAPTKLFNQDKTKSRLDPRRYGSWEGGIYNELRDFNQEYNQYQENIEDVNRILASEDFPARVSSMVGHTYLESQKENAANTNDMKSWKDADDKQAIHDIQAFLRAGKLDDLRAIYDEIGANLSDDDVENIVKSTTKEISAEEDKQNFDRQIDNQIGEYQRKITQLQQQAQNIGESQESLGIGERADYQAAVTPALEKIFQQIDDEYDAISQLEQQKQSYSGQKRYEGAYVDDKGNRTQTNDEIREEVKHNSDELHRKLNSYLDSIDYVNRRTGGQLTKDQENNLAYLHNMGKESNLRMQKIMANVRKQLPSKFLLKTDKTPEQLTQENASSDLTFSRDENTKEGYVEVDTSMMNDAAFADFFQREVMRGGNIRPEFGETAEEKAAREEEEQNLPEAEKKKKARERATKKWNDAIERMQQDADEQWDTNWRRLVDNFMDNYKKQGNTTLDETVEAFGKVRQDLQDASNLFDQAGEFQRTLMEYMQNPGLVDKAREKEQKKAEKAEEEQQQKNKFAGKDAKQMNQELADGTLDMDDLDEFAGADLSDVTDDDVKAAQQEAKKSQGIRQRQASLKQHIQDNLGDNPTQDELDAAQMAMQMVDSAALAADNPKDISIDMPELNQVPLDAIDPNASIDDIDTLNQDVQGMLADAFNAMQEDENAQEDIPDELPSVDGVDAPVPEDTGHDPITKTKPETTAPKVVTPSKAANDPLPKNPLTDGALGTIMQEMQKMYEKPSMNGTWRSTTTRHGYGRSTGTYHEDVAKQQYGEDSKEYKRSKAIWEYLNSTGAFDRQENASEDRIKAGDTVHFMVKYLPEVINKELDEMVGNESSYSLVIIMLNDNGEVIGDLPLAELEPSFKSGNPTQQVKDLMSLQKKVFDAFFENYKKTGANQAVVDSTLKLEDADNLNLTFDNGRKSLLVSKVKQVMKGVVPFSQAEKNTLNDVTNGQPMQLGVRVTGTTIAKKRGDKTQHKEIVAPKVGSMGQPYLLLPTASGEQMAIPFYMPAFNAEQHRNTEMYKMLSNAVYTLITNNSQTTARQKEDFMKALDVLKGLLQVEKPDSGKIVEVTGDKVTLHLQNLTDPNQKIDVSVPTASGVTAAAMAQSIVDALNGTPINVSLQFLNDKIEVGGRTADYNTVIGEIADVNLPKATNHTVNSWFTVELAPSTGVKPSKRVTPKITGTYTENIGGRNVEINTDNLTAVDTATGEIIEDDENINLMLAQIEAAKPKHKGKDRIQVSLNGKLRTYDVQRQKFVKNPTTKAAVEQQPTQPETQEKTPDVSEVSAPGPALTFAETEQTTVKIIEIEVPTTTGETRKEAVEKVTASQLKEGDLVWYSGRESDKAISRGIVMTFLENGDVVFGDGVVSKDRTFYRVSKQAPEAPQQPSSMTIEQIEEKVKKDKIIGRQNKDAWNAIPDTLKLKLFNDGVDLWLSFNKSRLIVSKNNMSMMSEILKEANMAAKGGTLKVVEGVKPMEKTGVVLNREKEKEARRWLAQNLPSLSSEERTQFVERLARGGDNAGKMWGSYRAGVIEIQRGAPMGTVYHEAFHYVMDMVLDQEERNQLLETAKQEYGLDDNWAAEERLANDFRRYAMDENATGIVGRIKRWLRKLNDRIRKYNKISDTTVNQLFWKINNGELAQKSMAVENFEDNQQRVLREIRNVQKERMNWSNLSSETKTALKDSGLSEAAYDEMSLEEKEQWVRCRG